MKDGPAFTPMKVFQLHSTLESSLLTVEKQEDYCKFQDQ